MVKIRLDRGKSSKEVSSPFPLVDVFEDENRVYVSLDLPGISIEECKIELIGSELIVSVEREKSDFRERSCLTNERPFGEIRRVIDVPTRTDIDGMIKNYNNGVLELELKKEERSKIHIPIITS